MSLIDGNIKDVFSIKLRCRHDGFTDQYNRILMVKMLIIFSIIMSMEFFSDKVSCIVPFEAIMGEEFVHSACWIRGFYIYKEMLNRSQESSYYGIPKDVENDGIDAHNTLCRTVSKTRMLNPECTPMTKLYYVQYQYLPFYVASLAVMFYVPYMFFTTINSDMTSLSSSMKKASTPEEIFNIVDLFFNYKNNGGVFALRFKILATVAIKFLYLFVSVVAFMCTDHLLNNNYITYGSEWLKWTRTNNSFMFGDHQLRGGPQPGNFLLPSMGFCDITEGSQNRVKALVNDYQVLCEISTHIIYQYVLFILWFLFVMSILLSFCGLAYYISRTTHAALCHRMCKKLTRTPHQPQLCQPFTVREMEYLEMIRLKDLDLYKKIVGKVVPRDRHGSIAKKIP